MRLVEKLEKRLQSGCSIGVELNEDGTVSGFEQGGVYPPPGYASWNVLEVGNGDTYGFYWPIGKESSPPIVCTTMHDSANLFPVASSFDRAVRLLAAGGIAPEEEIEYVATEFGINIATSTLPERDTKVDFWGRPVKDLYAIDADSPSILLAMAKEYRENGDLKSAQQFVERSLEVLPEYSDGWQMLAELRRQSRDTNGYAHAALRALTAPSAFGTFVKRRVLESLQRLPNSAYEDVADPFWMRRQRFTMAQGVHESPDYELMCNAIEEYHQLGQHIRAIYLRIVSGEWMRSQTVSFRERSKWSLEAYQAGLRQDHILAGITERLCAL